MQGDVYVGVTPSHERFVVKCMRDNSVELRHVLKYKDNPNLRVVPIWHVVRAFHATRISLKPQDYMSAIVMPRLVTLTQWARHASAFDMETVVCEIIKVWSQF